LPASSGSCSSAFALQKLALGRVIKGKKLVGAGDFHMESKNKLLLNTGV